MVAMTAKEEGEQAAATTKAEDAELGSWGLNSITTQNLGPRSTRTMPN